MTEDTITLRVVTYNVMLPVLPPIRFYGQSERSQRVKDVIGPLDRKHRLDVVVLNEVIPQRYERTITADLAALGFVHRTSVLQEILSVNGGIIIFSRYPIVTQANTTFGDDCTGSDCLAAKGVAYAAINREGQLFHVLATHMQAWPGVEKQMVREAQIQHIADFIQHLDIPETEPVLLCGDLNIDLYRHKDQLRHMMHRLQLDMPVMHPESSRFTVDPDHNRLVGSDDISEYRNDEYPHGCADAYYKTWQCPCCDVTWIDYTLYSKKHLKPLQATMQGIEYKVPQFEVRMGLDKTAWLEDVSDHFPVVGEFTFPRFAPVTPERLKTLDATPTRTKSLTRMNQATFAALVVLAVVLLVGGASIIYFLARRSTPRIPDLPSLVQPVRR